MIDMIKNFIAKLFENETDMSGVLYHISLAALSLVILSSLVLVMLMLRYRGKRPLDLTLLFREITFILVIARTFLLIFLGWYSAILSVAIFVALLIACLLTLVFVIQEHRQGRNVISGKV